MAEFLLPDVSAEHIIGVARIAATRDANASGRSFDRKVVERALNTSTEIARRAIVAAEQLGFVQAHANGGYTFAGDGRIRNAKKSETPLFLRKQLLGHPPFLIFVTQLTQEFLPQEAASFTVAVLGIESPPHTALKVLRSWGVFSGLLKLDGKVLTPTFEPVRLLELGFLRRLAAAMEDEAKVRTFVVQELGADLVADMSKRGLGDLPVHLADALVKHEADPRRIGDPVGSMIESYCATLFTTPVQSNSLPDIATKLEQSGVILTAHRNLLIGLAGFRHPASHGPDKKTQQPWQVTAKASLVGHLLALTALRSVHLWTHARRQEL
jgi:hypothetical protein